VRISYGKLSVPIQRVHRREDGGHELLAAEISIEVLGENFEAAYTEGDNREVVATDTMKNFILRNSVAYDGDTLQGLLEHLGRGFLGTYPVMEAVRMSGHEVRFDRLSGKLFARGGSERATAEVELDAGGVRDRRSGLEDLWLLKVTGSAFTRFARDENTTLPERVDRPLYIRLDTHWRGGVEPEAMREELTATFDDFVSESIQHLVHEMGARALARWPELQEIAFAAQNHTRDPHGEDGPRKLYSDPFPAYGLITLTMERG